MERKKTTLNIPPPPANGEIYEEELSGLLAVQYNIENAYPDNSSIVCRIYRILIGGKKEFIEKFDGIPDEQDIKNKFGGGSFCLMFFVITDGKEEFTKKSVNIHIAGSPKNLDVETPAATPEQQKPAAAVNTQDEFVQKILLTLLAKEAAPPVDNGKSMEVMGTMFAAVMTVITTMIGNKDKNPESELMKTLLPELLKNSFKKSNPIEDIKDFMEMKNLMDSGEGKGDFWSDIIKSAAPLLAAMAGGMNNGGTMAVPTVSADEVRRISRESAKEVINEEFPVDDNVTELTTEARSTQEERTQQQKTNQAATADSEENKQKTMIAALKLLPETEKIKMLMQYLKQYSYEQVKSFILDNAILKNEDEFLDYCAKAGYEVPAE